MPLPSQPAAVRTWFPLLPAFICLLVAILQMRWDWSYSDDYRYGWFVPPLALYLFSLRWRDRPPATHPAPLLPAWTVLGLFVAATLLIKEANPEWRFVSLALAAATVAASLLAAGHIGGSSWIRHFSGAAAFLLTSVPWPSALEQSLTRFLMPANASAVVTLLHSFNIPATRRGHLVTLASGTLGIEEACSGIRSLQCTIMAAWFISELIHLPWPRRFILAASAIAIAVLTNILRTSTLALAAANSGLAAVDSWHDSAGFLVLALNFALVLIVARRLSASPPNPSPTPSLPTPAHPATAAGPALCLALIFTGASLTEWWYQRSESTPLPPWHLAPPQDAAGFSQAIPSDRIVRTLRFSRAWSAKWLTPSSKPVHAFYMEWDKGAVPPENMRSHQPGICLPGMGMTLIAEHDPVTVPTTSGFPATARVFEFKDRGQPVFVFYIVQESSPIDPSTPPDSGNSLSRRLAAVRSARRNPGQRFVELGIWNEPSPANARTAFLEFWKTALRTGPL
jgi:exosortase